MNKQKLALVLQILCLALQNLEAQNWQTTPVQLARNVPLPTLFVEKWDAENGLPPFPIQKIRADKHGFLWMAHQNRGIARFDGSQTKWFFNNTDQPNSLPDNTVSNLIFDSKNGDGWLATQRGLVRFDTEREQFRLLPFFKPNSPCFSVLEDRDGQIWAGTVLGLARWDAAADSLVLFPEKNCRDGWTGKPLPLHAVEPTKGLTQDAQGRLWFSSAIYSKQQTAQPGIAELDPTTGDLTFWEIEPALLPRELFAFDTENNCLWLGFDGGGLMRFSLHDHSLQRWIFEGKDNLFNFVTQILPVGNDKIWVATTGGLLFFDLSKGTPSEKTARFSIFQINDKQSGQSENRDFREIFTDRHGAVWLGGEQVLFRVDPLANVFAPHDFLPPDFQAESVCQIPKTGEIVFAEHRDDGLLRFCILKKETNERRLFSKKCQIKPVENLEIQCLFPASDGLVWVGLDAALGSFDPISGKFSLLHAPVLDNKKGKTTDEMWVSQIAESENGDLWFATWNCGLVQFDRKNGQFFERTFNLDGRGKNLYNAVVHNVLIQKTSSGGERFLLSEFGTGLEIWQPALGQLQHFENANPHGPRGDFITSLLADGSGQIWVGSENGLARMTSDSTFEFQKLVQKTVDNFVADRDGRLWLWLREGLGLYDPGTGFFKIFGKKEGFRENFTAIAPFLADAEGQIWVGGHTVFSAEKISSHAPADVVPYICGLKIYGQPQPLAALRPGELPEMVFHPGQEVISIAFGRIAPGRQGMAGLQYCLDEGNREVIWTDAPASQNEVTFSHLPGGTYRFRVRTVDFRGNPLAGREAVLPFRVVPPFYRALWFWVLCAVGFAGAVYFYFKMKQNQRLEQEKNRLRIARDLHDEVGSLLSTISILSNSALRAVEMDLEKSRLASIGEKARTAMENMSDIVWAVNPLNDSMPQIIQRMTVFAAETLEAAGIELRFSVGPEVEKLSLPLEVRKDFYLIFKESVANCARHSHAGEASIFLKKENGWLVFELSDDGVGLSKISKNLNFENANSLGGNGLKNMAARARGFGGEFLIENNFEKGATVRLRMPLTG